MLTQALNFAHDHPEDSAYVENVMWEQSKVLFVTLNVPGGSNNDADNWFGLARTQPQTDEIAARSAADLRWLDAAFEQAAHDHVEAVVIELQADMWDLDSKPVTHLANYEPFIASIASHTEAFGKPVLLFNGDSHHYRSDNPLQQNQGASSRQGPTRLPATRSPRPWTSRRTPGRTTRITTSRTSTGSSCTAAREPFEWSPPDHQARHERAGGIECLRSLQLGAHPRRVEARPTECRSCRRAEVLKFSAEVPAVPNWVHRSWVQVLSCTGALSAPDLGTGTSSRWTSARSAPQR